MTPTSAAREAVTKNGDAAAAALAKIPLLMVLPKASHSLSEGLHDERTYRSKDVKTTETGIDQ
jgi:hypothetical protein